MRLSDLLTIAAILIGPVVAVAITLWIEGRRRRRDSQIIVLRQLMATRHLPSDPMYSAAINLIPVEFNGDPAVVAEHKAYHEALRQSAAAPADQQDQATKFLVSRQTKLICAIMRSLGLTVSEADLPVEAYAARGWTERDTLYLKSLQGTVRIADALEAQNRMVQVPQRQQPDLAVPQG